MRGNQFVPRCRLGLQPNEGKQFKGDSSSLPYVIEPPNKTQCDVKELIEWLQSNKQEIQNHLSTTGAVLFRGFDVSSAQDFEDVAQCVTIEPLQDGYLGVSPRKRVTQYVFTSSEFPPFFPIPQHIEMSFLPLSCPKMIFFCCLHPVANKNQGETPITDMRKVWTDLDPKVREKFQQKGIRNIRNYSRRRDFSSFWSKFSLSRLDPFRTKAWEDIFETTDKDAIQDLCHKDDVDVVWKKGSKRIAPHELRKNDLDVDLELVNEQSAFRKHPEQGTVAWANHSQVFHIDSMPSEYRRVAKRQGHKVVLWCLFLLAALIIFIKKLLVRPNDQPMYCQHANGEEIDSKDMEHVRDVIWQNSVFFDWRKGDILCLDNYSISHGRMPYSGKRLVTTCFS